MDIWTNTPTRTPKVRAFKKKIIKKAKKDNNFTDRVMKQITPPKVTPVGYMEGTEALILPNHSGDHSAGHVTTPIADIDIVNKKYVDDLTDIKLINNSVADTLHRHSELSASDGTPDPALSVDANGNVGIGTVSPQQLLHINNSIANEIGLRIEGVKTTGGTRYVDMSVAGDGRVNFGGNFLSFNFNNDVKVKDNINFIFGNNGDNWFKYDELYSDDFEFWSSDIDGSDTDGIVWFNHKGTDDMIFSGKVGIGTAIPSEKLDINSDAIRIRTAQTPASASATGDAGMICWDANYIYVCTATNTWKRTAIATW